MSAKKNSLWCRFSEEDKDRAIGRLAALRDLQCMSEADSDEFLRQDLTARQNRMMQDYLREMGKQFKEQADIAEAAMIRK